MAAWFYDTDGHATVYLSDGWSYESGRWLYFMDGKAAYCRD